MEFSRGRPIWVRGEDRSLRDRPEVVCRARSRLGEDRYHLLENNCEHFCEWCVRGQPRSYQVDELLAPCERTWQRVILPLVRVVLRLAIVVSRSTSSVAVVGQSIGGEYA
jgi:hypothetical protein